MAKYIATQDFWYQGRTLVAAGTVLELKPVELKWISHVVTPYVETPAVEVKAEVPEVAEAVVAVAKKVAKHKADEKAEDTNG